MQRASVPGYGQSLLLVSVAQVEPSEDDGESVVVNPVTVVTSLTPGQGPKSTKVTITGLNLTGATKVLFGTVAAKFTVVTATKITATAPGGIGTVAVRVTTPLSTSGTSSADKFTYSG
jgi:large repetitive protein